MANRVITAAVSGESIKLSNKIAGASGSVNAVSLSFTFDSAWDGTTKKVYFYDANEGNPVVTVLTTNLLVGGAYVVPIPAEPLAYAGEMTLTVRGVELGADGETAERIILSATTTMKVLNAVTPSSDVAPVEPTATQTEQLQAQIDEILGDVADIPDSVAACATSATAAAGSASSAAGSATNAATSETNASTSAIGAASSASAASGSASAASASETNAGNSAASATSSASAAATSASNAATSESNALSYKNTALSAANTAQTKASEAAQSASGAAAAKTAAETAQAAAEAAQGSAETAETNAETAEASAETAKTAAEAAQAASEAAQGAAETAQAGAEAAQNAAETAEGTATIKATEAGQSAAAALASKNTAAGSAATAVDSAATAVGAATDAQTAQEAAELAETNAELAETNAETAQAAAELALTHAPYIDDTTGNWFIWNATTSVYVDSGTYATGAVYQSEAPTGVVLWIDSDDDAISSVTKADIGLANVDNTSDANKPISTATQTALNAKVATSAIVNDLTTGGTAVPLSAEQGKVLSTSISTLATDTKFPVTNLVTNGDFSNGITGWTITNFTTTLLNPGIQVVSQGTSYTPSMSEPIAGISGNKYYWKCDLEKISGSTSYLRLEEQNDYFPISTFPIVSGRQSVSGIVVPTSNANMNVRLFRLGDAAVGDTFNVYTILFLNLTATFGSGNEPTAAEMGAMLAFYPNSWFDGTVNFAANPKLLPYLLNATRNRPIMASGTYAARPTRVTFPTLYLSTDKAAGNVDRLTLNVGGTTWLQI